MRDFFQGERAGRGNGPLGSEGQEIPKNSGLNARDCSVIGPENCVETYHDASISRPAADATLRQRWDTWDGRAGYLRRDLCK